MKMKTLSKVILMGYLEMDPTHKELKGGKKVSSFQLATYSFFKNPSDYQWDSQTFWHTIQAWGYLSEISRQYLFKGSLVLIEGFVTPWKTAQNKNKKQQTVTAQSIEILGAPIKLGLDF